MHGLIESIPPETRERLRALSREAEDIEWPAQLASGVGWRKANEVYQARQRELGAAETRALLNALNLQPPLDAPLLRAVLVAAVKLFFLTDQTDAEVHVGERHIRVDVRRCPIFARFADPERFGWTACGCFARRRGWYQALGIPTDEELISLRKWDDPACEFIIHIPLPAAVTV